MCYTLGIDIKSYGMVTSIGAVHIQIAAPTRLICHPNIHTGCPAETSMSIQSDPSCGKGKLGGSPRPAHARLGIEQKKIGFR